MLRWWTGKVQNKIVTEVEQKRIEEMEIADKLLKPHGDEGYKIFFVDLPQVEHV